MTSAKARFNNSLRPRKPEGSLGRTAQDVHLDSHTPELCDCAARSARPGFVMSTSVPTAMRTVAVPRTKVKTDKTVQAPVYTLRHPFLQRRKGGVTGKAASRLGLSV